MWKTKNNLYKSDSYMIQNPVQWIGMETEQNWDKPSDVDDLVDNP